MRPPHPHLRVVRSDPRDGAVRVQEILLAAVAACCLALAYGASTYVGGRFTVGGAAFREIQQDRIAAELLALQRADLNHVRAALGAVDEARDPEAVAATASIATLRMAVEDRFRVILALGITEERRLAVQDLHAVWSDFVRALDGGVALPPASYRHTIARRILRGAQRRLSARFNEQASAIIDLSRAEADARESAAVTISRRIDGAIILLTGLAVALTLVLIVRLAQPPAPAASASRRLLRRVI